MTGEEMVKILIESHRAVLRTYGIDPRYFPVEEMARNAPSSSSQNWRHRQLRANDSCS